MKTSLRWTFWTLRFYLGRPWRWAEPGWWKDCWIDLKDAWVPQFPLP